MIINHKHNIRRFITIEVRMGKLYRMRAKLINSMCYYLPSVKYKIQRIDYILDMLETEKYHMTMCYTN